MIRLCIVAGRARWCRSWACRRRTGTRSLEKAVETRTAPAREHTVSTRARDLARERFAVADREEQSMPMPARCTGWSWSSRADDRSSPIADPLRDEVDDPGIRPPRQPTGLGASQQT
jgi:hypothetical protein